MNPVYYEVMEMNFCRRCGTKLHNETERSFRCENGHEHFINAAPTAGIFLITNENKVLLGVRGIEPFKGSLDAIGGFIEDHESIEQGLAREIQEELGLTPDNYDQPVYLCSVPTLYPYGGEDLYVLGTFFWARLKPGVAPRASDDVASLQFVALDDIDLNQVALGDVRISIQKLKESLSGKL